jgi:hypothetical protein
MHTEMVHTHTHTHTHTQTKAKVLFADAKLMPIIATLDKAALKNLKHVVYFADTPEKPDEKMAGKVAGAMETIKKAGVDVVTLGDGNSQSALLYLLDKVTK